LGQVEARNASCHGGLGEWPFVQGALQGSLTTRGSIAQPFDLETNTVALGCHRYVVAKGD